MRKGPTQISRLPAFRRVPGALRRVDPTTILFESWSGQYSDNPRAISEELHRRGAPVQQVWAVSGSGVGIPPWAATVTVGTRRYLEALGTARRLVANTTMPGYFGKKRRTAYLQTWHGTPLKKIGFDIPRPFPGDERHLRRLAADVDKWDLLLSPNAFSTDIFRGAFRYSGRILETGYPRNDLLSAERGLEVRDEVRAQLGLGDGVLAVLYAPTWRDTETFDPVLDTAHLAEQLGDGHVLLVRPHQLAPWKAPPHARQRLVPVSSFPDIRDLYLAADSLVTDYSSAMFDFAVTGKPIVLFTYDLEQYRDERRGFYFDFEKDAPGPLVATAEELLATLQDLERVAAEHSAAYARFVQRFCHRDDGRAAARVADALLEL